MVIIKITVFKSNNYTKGGFVVFYEEKLLAVRLTKEFSQKKHEFMRHKSGDFVDWIINTYDMYSWETIPEDFLTMESLEIQERFSKVLMISYADIDKFKLSSSYKAFDEGVQMFRSGTMIIKGDGEKIEMDHDYKDGDPIYKQAVIVRKHWIELA